MKTDKEIEVKVLTTCFSEEIALIDELIEWGSSPAALARSLEYQAGERDQLLYMLCEKPLVNPFTQGTAQADAWGRALQRAAARS